MRRSTTSLILLILAGICLFLSCKKNNTGNLNGTYQSNGTMSVEPARLYVAGGVITDTSVTGPFARRFPVPPGVNPALGFLVGTSSASMPMTYRVQINDFQGTLYDANPNGSAAGLDVQHNPDLLLLARRDSATYFYQSPEPRCAQLLRRTSLDHSDSACYAYPNSGNFSGRACKYRSVLPLLVTGTTLTVPTQVVAIRSNGCVDVQYNAWSRFDESVAALLGSGDSILVQTRRVPLYLQ